MKYLIAAQGIVNGALSDTGSRAATGGAVSAVPFFVVNAGPSSIDYVQRLALFGGSSNLQILQARAVPLLAQGLREGLYFSQSGEPAFRANLYAPESQNYNLYLSKFNDWQPADAFFQSQGESALSLTMYSFNCCYDSFQIKSEFVGKQFGFRLELLVESSGGIVEP